MPVTVFSGNETYLDGPNLIRHEGEILLIYLTGREMKKMETYKKMAVVWAAGLVYAVGYLMGAGLCTL